MKKKWCEFCRFLIFGRTFCSNEMIHEILGKTK